MRKTVYIGERSLTLADYEAAVAGDAVVQMRDDIKAEMLRFRESLLRQLNAGVRMYGVNTGYGADSVNTLASDDLRAVQRNTIASHAVGVGEEASSDLVRGMLLLKANELAQGLSAVRPEVVELLLEFLHYGILPIVPSQGSLSASGDLVPHGHLALALIGEGEVRVNGSVRPARDALADVGLTPLVPEEKEGLALVNGTAFSAAWALRAVRDAHRVLQSADVIAAMTLEAMRGFVGACDARVTAARPHPGAILAATNMRALTAGSALAANPASRVHDAYSLRCLPQVHGASRDAWVYASAATEIELNSHCDNPLVIPDSDEWLSGGNFHGQPLAIPMDTLAVAIAEIASISHSRIQHLVSPGDGELPDKLSPQPSKSIGLFMCSTTAASLVSENKTLCFPASVDSIAVDGAEDHVSMASIAARKAHQVVRNTATVLGLELICAAQALDFRGITKTSVAARAVHEYVRQSVRFLKQDRSLHPDAIQLADRILEGEIAAAASEVLTEPLL
jgi:histidine ammonia-lyase